jgi:NADH dehydrogenase [ubiquinone] 1 alpha subcomplex assembly factor 7
VSLLERLKRRIEAEGPITVADYMQACLHDPEYGYYATRPALGADFITAPLVSQIFGVLLGAWAADVWTRMGSPPRVRLVELGPGDGTMMTDVLRAARAAPGFSEAIEVVLVETSAPLRALQAEKLPQARWINEIGELDSVAPLIVLANEFLDCLPIEQFVRTPEGRRARCIGLSEDGGLAFMPDGDAVSECSPAVKVFAGELAGQIEAAGGAALFVDYAGDGQGDTLQALRRHLKEDPLASPGEADLTARVDFGAFLKAARRVRSFGPTSQGAFLAALGLELRAAALSQARPERAETIARQAARLAAPHQMGELFQVVCLASPGVVPPGFA